MCLCADNIVNMLHATLTSTLLNMGLCVAERMCNTDVWDARLYHCFASLQYFLSVDIICFFINKLIA